MSHPSVHAGRLAAVMIGVSLVVAACEEPQKAAPAARPRTAAASADAGTSAEVVPLEVYTYNPLGKRDPFRSPAREMANQVSTGPCNEPLCQWDLDQLQLVAVVTGDANPFAMVEDPQGRGYIVRRNTKMGKKGGKVTQILRDSVTVTEFWTTPDGTQKPNPLSLSLKAEGARLPDVDINTGQQY